MATRTPLRDYERSRPEPSHGLLERAEEWAEETSLAPEGDWYARLNVPSDAAAELEGARSAYASGCESLRPIAPASWVHEPAGETAADDAP